MEILQNIKILPYTTLKLGGEAKYFIKISKKEDILEAVEFSKNQNLQIFVLGGGSNIIVRDRLTDKVFIKMENKGIETTKKGEVTLLSVKAGEIWDDFVDFTVKNNLSGLELLSLIPGTVGASPVQNIGAYGSEVSSSIDSITGFNIEKNKFETIYNKDCCFGYRDSIFKRGLKNKFIIETVVFKLGQKEINLPKSKEFIDIFNKNQLLKNLSRSEIIRKTIIELRNSKLPDPRELANVGSFFKNVFINEEKLESLKKKFPNIPHFKDGSFFKVPTAWLIEEAGFKGKRFANVGIYQKHALVLVNYDSKTSEDILNLANKIKSEVNKLFDIDIEIEPEIIS